MLSTSCPTCGQPKNPNARQCWKCSNESRRTKLSGVPHSEERRANIRAARQRQKIEGNYRPFDLAGYMRGRPSPVAKPIGYTRVSNGHIQIKCADGKFRYRARAMWEEAYGPIPRGYLIHHKNEDPFDDRLDNFQMVTRAEHALLHADSDTMRERGAKGGKPRLVKD